MNTLPTDGGFRGYLGVFFFEHLWVVLTFLTFQGIRQFI